MKYGLNIISLQKYNINDMFTLPQDPFILLSWTNTQLRDNYPSLEALCNALEIDSEELVKRLEECGYKYDKGFNKFW